MMDIAHEKIQGYLDKRNKKNLFLWWRHYWFVLDGKMLFYFKNKENYERLGPCKGSINMSMAQSVRPSSKTKHYFPLEIITRTKIVLLSACDEAQRTRWISALQKAIRLPEISSPMRERLSSRLSATLSLKRPFSHIEEETSAVNGLSERFSAVEIDGVETNKRNDTLKDGTICQANLHNGTLSLSENTENIGSSGSSVASTLTDGENEEVAAKTTKYCRKRKLSLYEEIVEEVLEIAGKRLSSQSSQEGTDEHYLRDLSLVLNHEAMAENAQNKAKPPSKPPRIPSMRIASTIEANGNPAKKCTFAETSRKELETESEKYESANESCYVTAESSEYEGDTSSFASSICDAESSLFQVEQTDLQASAGSEASVESIQAQTGSLCNMLDVVDDGKSHCEVKDEETPIFCSRKQFFLRKSSLKLSQDVSQETKFRKFSQ